MHRGRLLGRHHRLTVGWLGTIGAMVVCAALVACGVLVVFGPELTDLAATRKACDRAVDVVLTSRDPVELQRSGILIRALDCSVSRRLPKEP